MKTLVLLSIPACTDTNFTPSQAKALENRMLDEGYVARAMVQSNSDPEPGFMPGQFVWIKTFYGRGQDFHPRPSFSLINTQGSQTPCFSFHLDDWLSWSDQRVIVPEPSVKPLVISNR